MMSRRLIAFLVVALGVSGCDSPFLDPYENDQKYFTIWGWIDPEASLQTVRIVPVTRTPAVVRELTDANASINARVFSIDLETNAETEWVYAAKRMEDNTYAHTYSAPLFVRPGARFRLEVRRSDGRVAYAETQIPSPTAVTGIQMGEVITNDLGEAEREVTFRGVRNPWGILVTYRTQGDATGRRFKLIEYGREGHLTESGDWVMTLRLSRDLAALKADLLAALAAGEFSPTEEGGLPPVVLDRISVRLLALTESWEIPEDPVDVEIWARPDALTNVVNGYGFWGSAVAIGQQFEVTREESDSLGWTD